MLSSPSSCSTIAASIRWRLPMTNAARTLPHISARRPPPSASVFSACFNRARSVAGIVERSACAGMPYSSNGNAGSVAADSSFNSAAAAGMAAWPATAGAAPSKAGRCGGSATAPPACAGPRPDGPGKVRARLGAGGADRSAENAWPPVASVGGELARACSRCDGAMLPGLGTNAVGEAGMSRGF